MNVVKKFNGLHGAVITKKDIQKMLIQAKKDEQPELVQRLENVLSANPNEKDFKFKIKTPAIECLPASMLPGFQIDDVNEESGLSGVSQDEIYSMVTDMILNTIKNVGHLPWQKEWSGSGGYSASNYVTKKPYRGINFILNFEVVFDKEGNPYLVPITFEHPYYLTFKQIEAAGAKLKKGSKSRKVFYYSMIFKYDDGRIKIATSDKLVFNAFVKENGISTEQLKEYSFKIPVIKYYNVYRADHCTGLKFPEKIARPIVEPIEVAQAIIDNYPNPPRFTFGGDDAVYYPTADTVNMPHIEDFKQPAYYYGTYFHEIIHSTGHKSRLDRGLGRKPSPRDYAFEELIAELGAVYLCSEAGILFTTKDNSAKYLRGWNSRLVGAMKDDNKFFFKAAAAAQKATDHILDLDAEDVPAYLSKVVKKTKPAKKEKPGKKGKSIISRALESFFDNVEEFVYPEGAKRAGKIEYTAKHASYVLSIKPNNKGFDVFLGKPGKDVGNVFAFNEIGSWFPLNENELLRVIQEAPKLIKAEAGKVNSKEKKTDAEKDVATPLPRSAVEPIRKRKQKDPGQLTLGLNGKRKASKKQGLNGLVTHHLVPEATEPVQQDPAPVKPCPVPETTISPVRPGSLAQRRAQRQNEVQEYYTIENPDIAKFLGEIEKKKKESVVITLAGKQGSMKTRCAFQFMNDFAQNYRVGHASIEEHPDSTVYHKKVDDYLNDVAQNNIDNPEITSIEVLHRLILENDVIVIDSFAKMQELCKGFEVDKDLRKKYDGKLFLVIFQQTSDGSMRGGTKSQFDADIVLLTESFSNYEENYVYPDKNRYNNIPADKLKFNIFSGKLLKSASEPQNEPEQQPVQSIPRTPLKFQVI